MASTKTSDVIALVSDIQQQTNVTTEPSEDNNDKRSSSGSNSQEIVRLVGTLLPCVLSVLESSQESFFQDSPSEDTDGFDRSLESLKENFERLQAVVSKANVTTTSHNRIAYLVLQAASLHEGLESCLQKIFTTLWNIYFDDHTNHALSSEYQQFHQFDREWKEHDKERKALKRRDLQERHILVHGSEDVVAHVLAAMDSQELEQANEIIKTSCNDSEQQQYDVLFLKILSALQHAKRIQQSRVLHQEHCHTTEIPNWSLCSITGEIMRDPVTVDCPSYHSFERHAIEEWMISRGNNSCPLDREPFETLDVISNVLLQKAIMTSVNPALLVSSSCSNSSELNEDDELHNNATTRTRVYRNQLRRYGPWFGSLGLVILGTGIALIILAEMGDKNTLLGMTWIGCVLFWFGLSIMFAPFVCPPRLLIRLRCCCCCCWRSTTTASVLPTMTNNDNGRGDWGQQQQQNQQGEASNTTTTTTTTTTSTDDVTSSARNLCCWMLVGLVVISIGVFLRLGILVNCKENDIVVDVDDDNVDDDTDCPKADGAIRAGTYILHIVGFFIILVPLGCLR